MTTSWYVPLYHLPEINADIVGDHLGAFKLFPHREHEDHLDMMDNTRVERISASAPADVAVFRFLPKGYGDFDSGEGGRVHGQSMLLKARGCTWRFRATFSSWSEKWYVWGDNAELLGMSAARTSFERFRSGCPDRPDVEWGRSIWLNKQGEQWLDTTSAAAQ